MTTDCRASSAWSVRRLSVGEPDESAKNLVRVTLEVTGAGEPEALVAAVTEARGVRSVDFVTREDLD